MADLNISIGTGSSGTATNIDIIGVSEDVGNNLINNGNFESYPAFVAATTTLSRWIDGTAGGSQFTAAATQYRWFLASVAGSASAQFDTTTFNSGTASMKVSTTATASTAVVSNTVSNTTLIPGSKNAFSAIPMQPSTKYTLTFWMKTTLNSGTTTNGAKIRLREYNNAGTALFNNDSTGITTTTNWTQYTINFTSNASTDSADIELTVASNTGTAIMDVWFDDIVLTHTTNTNGPQVAVSPIVTPGNQDVSGPKIWG
jgi:hypothetical protein